MLSVKRKIYTLYKIYVIYGEIKRKTNRMKNIALKEIK